MGYQRRQNLCQLGGTELAGSTGAVAEGGESDHPHTVSGRPQIESPYVAKAP